MSSKTTLMITDDNEMFYSDCNEPIMVGHKRIGDAITLEFDKKNIRIDCNDETDLIITLHKDSDLYQRFKTILRG